MLSMGFLFYLLFLVLFKLVTLKEKPQAIDRPSKLGFVGLSLMVICFGNSIGALSLNSFKFSKEELALEDLLNVSSAVTLVVLLLFLMILFDSRESS